MVSADNATYTYNAQGLRVSKTVGNATTNFLLVGGNVWSDGTTNYTRGIELISNGTQLYLYNVRGDVIQLLGFDGEVDKTYDYDAYGNEYARDLGDSNPFRYCGEYYDTETGFIYLRARYYDPRVGRFTSVDPAKDGLNWYAYCGNDPVNFVDPSGFTGVRNDRISKYKDFDFHSYYRWYEWYNSYDCIKYDVPLYDQNGYSLCWAFCQVMIEDYENDVNRSNFSATWRAISVAIEVHDTSIFNISKWNQGEWPQNLGDKILKSEIENLQALYNLINDNGPIYAYYYDSKRVAAHLVVVTGVDLESGIVYTNNPHGIAGEQTYDDFLNGYAGMSDDRNSILTSYYLVQ